MRKISLFIFCSFVTITSFALPQGFVYLHDVAPDIIQDMRYATSNNFIGNSIPGYKKGVCIVTQQAAEQLKKAQKEIKAKGYSLKVYDCYRPQRAVNYFYQWSQKSADQRQKAAFYPREPKDQLFKRDYIALSSGHTRGSTVDLTLVKLNSPAKKQNSIPFTRCYDISPNYADDDSIDMGTRFDCLDRTAHIHYDHLSKSQKENRLLLQQLMIKNGFKPYLYEWWHYTLKKEPYPNTYFDFPVS
ncbi:M15 family metallopeptidase [Legionella fallonii]|uniref:D-alanyl-D-alanine dipeptidase n=1 Tax=Legionella fallonii LLAP-10 TaxID=1212491 RepID=A0A098G5V2_9GAMM|nr:M15 family metallopeptidase [Legionella fallonii]CEG57883.1 D-alanyl-D-alanine dipeptidase [Legionella fallonii LLAP-10]